MAVDLQQAAWLKSDSLVAQAVPSTGVIWDAARANDVKFTTPIDGLTDANTEAARTIALLRGPNVKERVSVKGRRRDLLFKCISVSFTRLGYVNTGTLKKVFVIGVAEDPENNTTILTVLRSLA